VPPDPQSPPEVSFIIGHRGLERLPNLLETLRSIAGQVDAAIECIVVEQSASPEVEGKLPPWVRYVHTPVPPDMPYCRSATFNAGAAAARGVVLILHDNDILVPKRYAAEVLARVREGARFVDLKRFLFYLSEDETLTSIEQNLQGGSIAATREAYAAVGGFDEGFIGWGGEDNDFRERAHALGAVYAFGYLPMIHLWHPPQPGKRDAAAPAVRRYWEEIRHIPAEERIRRLRKD
jgi:GT2 family glycosyltransferase